MLLRRRRVGSGYGGGCHDCRTCCIGVTYGYQAGLVCRGQCHVNGRYLVTCDRPDPFDTIRFALSDASYHRTKDTGGVRCGRQVATRAHRRLYRDDVCVTFSTMGGARDASGIFLYGGAYSEDGNYLPFTPARELRCPTGHTTSDDRC